MIETLKFPSGEFTHSELAVLNGKTNQQVWVQYQAAIKSGIIVSAGTRSSSGRGKPSKLWRLASGQPIPIASNPPVEVKPKIVSVSPVIVPTSFPSIPKPEKIKEIPSLKPAKPPTVIVVEEVPIIDVEAIDNVETIVEVVREIRKLVLTNTRMIKEVCPVCKNPLMAGNDNTGVIVWCNQDAKGCKSSENPFGHGRNEKEAFFILTEKWTRAMS